MKRFLKNTLSKTCLLVFILSPAISIAQNASLTLSDYNLKGNVKEVSEAVFDYDNWKKESKRRTLKLLKFDSKGFITYLKSDPIPYKDEDFIYETSYTYKNNHTEMVENNKTFLNNVEQKEKARNETYNLIKTSIGYIKDYKPSPSIKRNPKGDITNYTWYSPNSNFGSSSYTFEYKDGYIYETKTALVTSKYNSNGLKTYDFVLASPSYFYYNSDGFLNKKVYYPLSTAVYDYYEYIKDNRGNWVQKRRYVYYTNSGKKWDIKEIHYRKITYQDGLVTGSDVFNQNDLNQALTTQINLPVWTDDPWAIDRRQANQGCEKGDCQNGFGKYNYENGTYEGFFKNGKKHGMGNYQWNDNSIYMGNWENDQMSGYGFYSKTNDPNFKNYFGYFKNGNFDGKGYMDKSSSYERGIYQNGTLVTPMNFYTNKVDRGCTAGDCQNAFGRFVFDNGDSFDGFFVNGVQTFGTYRFKAGGSYNGEFNNAGQFHGKGFYLDSQKNIFYGNWQNGSLNGLGVQYEEATKKYKPGVWSNGTITQTYDY